MQVNRIINLAGALPAGGKYRIAAYCRVSTEMESQAGSFELQQKVYLNLVEANPSWELAGIYADEGSSGTSVKARKEFKRMIKDAKEGKIDYIITKSISRFARNTLDCLRIVRSLREIGVELYFEKEGIDTGSSFSEMLLTILAAFAQEESRSISENVKWGIRKQHEQLKPRWSTCYGYTKNDEEEYIIVDEEAAIIREIFRLYTQGETINSIKQIFTEKKVPTPTGKTSKWDASAINRILSNEKYMGDVKMQKSYTIDHLTHLQRKNNGVVPEFYIKDHHQPIVSRKVFERAQMIKAMRNQGGGKSTYEGHALQYPFDEYLKCPYCGATLRRKKVNVQKANGGWCCEECGDFILRAEIAEEAVVNAYNSIPAESLNCLKDSKAKQLFLQYKKQKPNMERADYYWIDDLIDHIDFGEHTYFPSELRKNPGLIDDNTITVFWRAGLKTTTSTRIIHDYDLPRYVADLYNAYMERKQARDGVVA